MKARCLKLIVVSALLAVPGTVLAHDGHEHGASSATETENKTESKTVADPLHAKSLDELLVQLQGVVESVAAAVNAKELGKLHELTEELSHLATHVAEKAPVEKQTRVSGSAKNISSLAASLHSDADKNDQVAVERDLKKLQAMMTVLTGQLK